MEKAVWLRLGVTAMFTEAEISEIRKGDAAGRAIIRDKVRNGKFFMDGETYIPSGPGSDNEWPIDNDIEFAY